MAMIVRAPSCRWVIRRSIGRNRSYSPEALSHRSGVMVSKQRVKPNPGPCTCTSYRCSSEPWLSSKPMLATVELAFRPLLLLDMQILHEAAQILVQGLGCSHIQDEAAYPILLLQAYLHDGLGLILPSLLLSTHGKDDFIPMASDHV